MTSNGILVERVFQAMQTVADPLTGGGYCCLFFLCSLTAMIASI